MVTNADGALSGLRQKKNGVIAASAGNHALALAYHGTLATARSVLPSRQTYAPTSAR